MQIKGTIRYHLTHARMATIIIIIITVGKDVEKREPSYTVGGNVSWYSHHGKQYRDSQKKKKLKIELPYDPALPLLCIYMKTNTNSQRYTHPKVHHSTIYNSQDMEAT